MIYLDSPEQDQDSASLYQASYYRKLSGVSKIIEAIFLRERKNTAGNFIKKPGTLLDVGCGTGEFAAAMKRAGWDASGVEPSRAAEDNSAAACKIYRGTLPEMKLPSGSFSVITMWQVLEHLPDPAMQLTEIHRLLEENGILVVSVPNINSLQARASGNKWFHLDLPRHCWQFSPDTVSRLLDRAGFRIKEIKHFSLEYNPYGWWQSLFNMIGCEINFAYKHLKRGSVDKNHAPARRAYTVLCTVLLSLPLLPVAFILSLLESALGRGGVITVTAEKK